MIGGLEGILKWWPDQARQAFPEPGQIALVDKAIDLIAHYGTLPDLDERCKAIDDIERILSRIAPEGERVEVPQAEISEGAPMADAPAIGSDSENHHPHSGIRSPVTVLSGVGVKQAARLKRLGIETIQDMLYFFPRRHDDYSRLKPIARLLYGEQVTVIGTIRSTKLKRHRGGAAIVNTIVADGSGAIQATWFNQPYLAQQLKRGRQIVLSGQVDEYLGRKVMTSPRWEPLEAEQINTGRLVPVYPLTEGVGANWLRKMIKPT
ncbi:MAG: hypothetical protein JXA89_14690, partial [Anaerolineae bacterium]|nr:hypothetical protein [Anaerolineae bacterium]